MLQNPTHYGAILEHIGTMDPSVGCTCHLHYSVAHTHWDPPSQVAWKQLFLLPVGPDGSPHPGALTGLAAHGATGGRPSHGRPDRTTGSSPPSMK